MVETQKPPLNKIVGVGALCAALCGAANLDRVRPFRAVCYFKGYLVSLTKFVERNADQLVGVEKEILFLTLARDEPETLVSETGDSSCLHRAIRIVD